MQANKAIIGNKFKVTKGSTFIFPIGTIVTFVRADDEYGGYFEDDAGNRKYKEYANIEPVNTVEVGGLYEVIADEGDKGRYFKAGERVKALRFTDGSRPYFTSVSKRTADQAFGTDWYTDASNVKPVKRTHAEEAGLVIGQKYELVCDSMGWFAKGTVVTFTRDDGSYCPEFTGISNSPYAGTGPVAGYAYIEDVKPYVEKVKTPAEEAGFVLGQKYTIERISEAHCGYDIGDVVEFTEDDGTDMPLFRRVEDGYEQYAKLDVLKAYVAPVATEAAGFAVGKLYKVVDTTGHCYKVGDVVKLIGDLCAESAKFERVKGGDALGQWLYPSNVEDYVETPAEQAGIVVGGDAYLLELLYAVPAGTRITLAEDDGTDMPLFTVKEGHMDGSDLYFALSKVTTKVPTSVSFDAGFFSTTIRVGGRLNQTQRDAIKAIIVAG